MNDLPFSENRINKFLRVPKIEGASEAPLSVSVNDEVEPEASPKQRPNPSKANSDFKNYEFTTLREIKSPKRCRLIDMVFISAA